MRLTAIALASLLLAGFAAAQTSVGVDTKNSLRINNVEVPSPCSPNFAAAGTGFITFDIKASDTSTAAFLFLDPCPTRCGLFALPPVCYAGMGANTLDIGACGIVTVALPPIGQSTYSSGMLTGIPPGFRFSVQGVIVDPGCVSLVVFTQANDVQT